MATVSKTALNSLGKKIPQNHAPKECVVQSGGMEGGVTAWDLTRNRRIGHSTDMDTLQRQVSRKGYSIVSA